MKKIFFVVLLFLCNLIFAEDNSCIVFDKGKYMNISYRNYSLFFTFEKEYFATLKKINQNDKSVLIEFWNHKDEKIIKNVLFKIGIPVKVYVYPVYSDFWNHPKIYLSEILGYYNYPSRTNTYLFEMTLQKCVDDKLYFLPSSELEKFLNEYKSWE